MLFVLRPQAHWPPCGPPARGVAFSSREPHGSASQTPRLCVPGHPMPHGSGHRCGGKSAHTLPRAAAQSPEGSRDPAPYLHSAWHQGGPRDGHLCSNTGAARGPILAALYGPTPTFWKERVSHVRFSADPERSLPSPSCLPSYCSRCPLPCPGAHPLPSVRRTVSSHPSRRAGKRQD